MKTILKTCIEVENRVGEIYRHFMSHPDAGEELREIWGEMADDEMHHAERIRQVGARFERAGVMACRLNLDSAQQLLDRAVEILIEAHAGRLTLLQAIQISLELEEAFLKVHLGYSKSGNQPDLQTMFKSLAEADREHTCRLKAYLERLSSVRGSVLSEGQEL
jgi:rubrerythrin